MLLNLENLFFICFAVVVALIKVPDVDSATQILRQYDHLEWTNYDGDARKKLKCFGSYIRKKKVLYCKADRHFKFVPDSEEFLLEYGVMKIENFLSRFCNSHMI